MRIRSDLLQISSGALNVKGQKLEPEEQMVRREVVVEGGAEVKLGYGQQGKVVGSIPKSIVTEHSAVEFARKSYVFCANCKHFRNDLFLRDLAKAEAPGAPIARRRAVNQIRANIMQTQHVSVTEAATGKDGDLDVEAILRTGGYCVALYEFFKNAGQNTEEAMTLVLPASHCPADVCNDAMPDGFFELSGVAAKALATAQYDAVMHEASGKGVK